MCFVVGYSSGWSMQPSKVTLMLKVNIPIAKIGPGFPFLPNRVIWTQMEFGPNNPVVKLSLQGLALEANGQLQLATESFREAWEAASTDHERFIASYHLARVQATVADRLRWLETALQHAAKSDPCAVQSAMPLIHAEIARCHDDLHQPESAQGHRALADSSVTVPSDKGPFYHGTRADLGVGDLLLAGGLSNYQSDLTMNHIYFTALPGGAGLAASLAKGEGPERVYVVEPTGDFEDDPNVTNKKFPGNPTRSYRSRSPLRIVGERTDWVRQTAAQQQEWRNKLAKSKGEIIN